jgi:hypothetical protein
MTRRVCPTYLTKAGIAGATPTYKWTNDVALKLYARKDQSTRLYKAAEECSFRANMALLTLVSDCIVWRFEGLADLADANLRVEAAWAAAIHPAYAKDAPYKMTKDPTYDDRHRINGPIECAMAVLERGRVRYASGNIYLTEMFVKQAVIARHVIPKPKAFEAWLLGVIERTARTFPRTGTYDTQTGVHDASAEPPVPRAFFGEDFVHSEEGTAAVLSEFLGELDPNANPYLRTPPEMLAAGFEPPA